MKDLRLFKPDENELLRKGLETILGKKEAEDAYWRIVRRVGEEPVTVLGHGDKGVVYGLPSGKILKVTSDEGELRAMNMLRGARHPNIVQVFDAFLVPLASEPDALGVVVRESVDQSLQDIPGFGDLKRLLRMSVFRSDDVFKERRQKIHPHQALWEAMLRFKDELHGEDAENLTAVERLLVDGIESGMDELLAREIFFLDAGPSNVGLIEGRPVLYDLSLASVPREAPDLELGRREKALRDP
jgi:hypothetical protein